MPVDATEAAPVRSLELIELGPGHYTVIVDGRFADMLCKDEALGVVAAVIFSNSPPHYLRTYVEWLRWHKKYHDDYREPVALLPEKPSNLIPFQGFIPPPPPPHRAFPFKYEREMGSIKQKMQQDQP